MNIMTVKKELHFDGTLNEFKNFLRLKTRSDIEFVWYTMTKCYCREQLRVKFSSIGEGGIETSTKIFIETIELPEKKTLIKLRTKIRKLDIFIIIISFGLIILGNFIAIGVSSFFPYFFVVAAFIFFAFNRNRDNQLLDYLERVIIVRSIL